MYLSLGQLTNKTNLLTTNLQTRQLANNIVLTLQILVHTHSELILLMYVKI